MSKPITSVALFSLVEKGVLRTEATVFGERGVLGTRYGKFPYGQGIEQITIDHLLTHTSGGWDNRNDPMFTNPGMDQAELIAWALNTVPLKNPPGKVFAYSNFGYCLLGRVIEKITGQPYSDFVQTTILQPCGITDMRIAGNTLKDRAPEEVSLFRTISGTRPQRRSLRYQRNQDGFARRLDRDSCRSGAICKPCGWVRRRSQYPETGNHSKNDDSERRKPQVRAGLERQCEGPLVARRRSRRNHRHPRSHVEPFLLGSTHQHAARTITGGIGRHGLGHGLEGGRVAVGTRVGRACWLDCTIENAGIF